MFSTKFSTYLFFNKFTGFQPGQGGNDRETGDGVMRARKSLSPKSSVEIWKHRPPVLGRQIGPYLKTTSNKVCEKGFFCFGLECKKNKRGFPSRRRSYPIKPFRPTTPLSEVRNAYRYLSNSGQYCSKLITRKTSNNLARIGKGQLNTRPGWLGITRY